MTSILPPNSNASVQSSEICNNSVITSMLYRVTIRPGFPGHVLFFGLCPGGFSKMALCPGFWPNPQVHLNAANCKGVRRHETKKACQFSIQDVSNISKCNTCHFNELLAHERWVKYFSHCKNDECSSELLVIAYWFAYLQDEKCPLFRLTQYGNPNLFILRHCYR